ncbi:hypothetical protein PLESTM_000518500 [Pleodorina starrii]|nr:hypothetical protein PLESTM_000518500 [Pleodorina starrii]
MCLSLSLSRSLGLSAAESRFKALSGLVGEAMEAERAVAARLAPALAEALQGVGAGGSLLAAALDLEALARLLRKEQLNSYGVLASRQQAAAAAAAGQQQRQQRAGGEGRGGGRATTASGGGGGAAGGGAGEGDEDGERRLRGSALYAQASLINHECLPNVARFDFFDALRPDAGSTHVTFRALHDLPPGTELAQSYVPLHWSLQERQAQCREVYGFDCTCPRCQTESQWSDEEEEGEENEWETDSGDGGDMETDAAAGEEAAGEEAGGDDGEVEMQDAQPPIVAPPGEEGPLEPTYLRLFLLKYMCSAPGCFGTAAPPKPGSTVLECNVCGRARSEKEFLRELERNMQPQQQQQRERQEQQQQRQQGAGRSGSARR